MSNSYDRNKSQRKPQENRIANMSKEQMQKLMSNIGGLGIHGGPSKKNERENLIRDPKQSLFDSRHKEGTGRNVAAGNRRLQQNPGRGFAALEKLMKKMPKEQQEALRSNLDSVFSNKGLGGGEGGMADKYNNMNPYAQRQATHMGRYKLRDAGLTSASEDNQNVRAHTNAQPTRSSLMPQAPPPQLNLGGIQGGAMGMGGQQPARRGPLDSGNYGGLPGAPGAQTNQPKGTSPPGGTPPKTLASFAGVEQSKVPPTATSANTTPTTSPPTGMSAQGAAASLGGGVNTNQLQNAVAGSASINSPVNNAQAMFQGTYGDLINMPGQGEVANQFSTPGMSMVGGQYGQGGLAANQMQKMANDATTTGLQNRQQMIGQNINQGMAAGQMASQMDMGQRQQVIGHLGTMLGPALSGVTQGFQSGVGGLTTNI